MNIDDKKLKINAYFDGELNKEEEILIFSELSSNEELREYFKNVHVLKEGISDTLTDVPELLDAKILMAAAENNSTQYKPQFAFSVPQIISYSVSLVMIVLVVVFYSQSKSFEQKFETTIRQVNQQNQTIELLMNGLPEAKIEEGIDEQIIIRANL